MRHVYEGDLKKDVLSWETWIMWQQHFKVYF